MYRTCMLEASEKIEEKRSVFIGQIKRVYTEDEAKDFIESTRKKHREANHNCWAFALGEKKFIKRYSDDGEPQGTAGIPILECINKKDITFAVIVVTRFFGGILLGAGGLVRAYIKAASSAIDKSGIIEVVKGSEIDLIISYDLLRKFQYLFSENKIYIEDIVYTDKVEIKCIIESSNIDFFKRIVRENSYGKFNLNCDKEREYFKLGNRLFLNLK